MLSLGSSQEWLRKEEGRRRLCELPRGSNYCCGGPHLVAYLENLPYDCPFIWHTSIPDNDFLPRKAGDSETEVLPLKQMSAHLCTHAGSVLLP